MIAVKPTLYEGARLIVFAKDQPEYNPLPVVVDEEGNVTTEWELTEEEINRLVCGGRVRLCVCTFDPDLGKPGHYLQPVSLDVLEPDCGTKES